MKRNTMVIAVGLLVVSATMIVVGQPATVSAPAKVRIGTYDNRAIAVAYAASSFNPVSEKMRDQKEAKAAGDTAKVKELEAWGKNFQRQLHFQGFGHTPVGDLLAPVKEGVASYAAAQNLAAIVMECDYTAPGVETVDVTDALVALYAPTPKTLENVRMVRAAKPVSLVELADLPADQ
jgi:hypothetical protein